MARTRRWMLLAAMVGSGGCLGGQQSYGGGDDDDNGDVGGDADGDTDTGSGTGEQWTCPAYPTGTVGMTEGSMLDPALAYPGNDDTAIPYVTYGDSAWSMGEFWCMSQVVENPKTVLVMNIHSST